MPTKSKGPGVSAFGAADAIRKRKAAAKNAGQETPGYAPGKSASPPADKSDRKNRGNSQDYLTREQAEAIRNRKKK